MVPSATPLRWRCVTFPLARRGRGRGPLLSLCSGAFARRELYSVTAGHSARSPILSICTTYVLFRSNTCPKCAKSHIQTDLKFPAMNNGSPFLFFISLLIVAPFHLVTPPRPRGPDEPKLSVVFVLERQLPGLRSICPHFLTLRTLEKPLGHLPT